MLQVFLVVSALPFSTSGQSQRRVSRWGSRAGAALLVSAAAHALAAIAAGAVLYRFAARGPDEPLQAVDIDVSRLVVPPPQEVPAAAVRASQRPSRQLAPQRHAAVARRVIAPPDSVVEGAPTLSAVPPINQGSVPVRFGLRAGTVATRPSSAEEPSTIGSRDDVSRGSGVLAEGDVNVPARLLASIPVVYPPRASQAEIEVDLPVEIVVDNAGRVTSARGLTPAGYGLDEAALDAIRAYRFFPALRDGRPVAVRMRWTVQFRLR